MGIFLFADVLRHIILFYGRFRVDPLKYLCTWCIRFRTAVGWPSSKLMNIHKKQHVITCCRLWYVWDHLIMITRLSRDYIVIGCINRLSQLRQTEKRTWCTHTEFIVEDVDVETPDAHLIIIRTIVPSSASWLGRLTEQ